MEVSNIIKGLQIIQKSKPKEASDYHLRTNYTEIYAGSLDWEMSVEDKKRMAELGWESCSDGWRALI